MARFYSDIFKFQTAYSQGLAQLAISVVPLSELGKLMDSNVVNFERIKRELPSAELSITLPILVIGIAPDEYTKVIDISSCKFSSIKEITGKGKNENKWKIINAYFNNDNMSIVDENYPTGIMLESINDSEE
jgi:hypothetical protein